MGKETFMPTPPKTLTANLYRVQEPGEPGHEFPEIKHGVVNVTDKSVALCLSGGGSRALACSVGYLRGLHQLGLDEEPAYISCVSGGSWCGSLYTFLDGSTEEIVGAPTDPSEITPDFLKDHFPGKIADTMTKFEGLKQLFHEMGQGAKRPEWWKRVVGGGFLSPHGLEKSIMVQNETEEERIKAANPELTKYNFIKPKKSPFLIIGGTLEGPRNYMTGWGNGFQMTPLYSGVPYWRNNEQMVFPSSRCCMGMLPRLGWCRDPFVKMTIGGGFIETFAFGKTFEKMFVAVESDTNMPNLGSKSPMSIEEQYNQGECQLVSPPKHLFTLEDAIGISSSAFVAEFQNKGFGKNLVPMNWYFPVQDKEYKNPILAKLQKSKKLTIGDGGNYENLGIIVALQRGVKRVICAVNSSRPLDKKFVPDRFFEKDEDGKVGYAAADGSLLALFGCFPYHNYGYNYADNQVFETSEMNSVMEELLKNVNSGKGGFCRKTLKVVSNDAWNIVGGYDVDVIFLYNEVCQDFVDKLPDATKNELKNKDGELQRFPHYKTTLENAPKLFNLTTTQTNILTSQMEYVIKEHSSDVKDLFA